MNFKEWVTGILDEQNIPVVTPVPEVEKDDYIKHDWYIEEKDANAIEVGIQMPNVSYAPTHLRNSCARNLMREISKKFSSVTIIYLNVSGMDGNEVHQFIEEASDMGISVDIIDGIDATQRGQTSANVVPNTFSNLVIGRVE